MSNIFENIESEKPIELNERVWQRVEDKLDINKYKSKSNKYRWVAAAAILVVIVGTAIQTQNTSNKSEYQVTDFNIEGTESYYQQSIEDRSYLKKIYDNLVNCKLKKDKYSC